MSQVSTLEDRILLTAYDFGDAPYPYPVTLAENGPRHASRPSSVGSGVTFGAKKDSEADGTHSAAADADGADEDGVTFGTIRAGQIGATIIVNVQNYIDDSPGQRGTPRLDAWVDFNQDGTWGGPFEQIAPSLKLRRGNNTISFNVPAWAGSGTTFARFRISEYGNLSVTGVTDHYVDPGEVEDYAVTILPSLTTDGNFDSENVISSTEPGPVASVAADIDRDGDMDVVSGFYGSSTVTWFENDDEENFTAHAISASADGIRSLVASDLDRDGDMDIVAALADSDPSHHRFEWYKNDGSGNFTVQRISTATAPGDDPSDPGPRSVFVADVDGDADLDVIVGMDSPTKVAWYRNNGSQVFTKHSILDSSVGEGNSVFGADVDRDGDMDVVSALRGGGLSWFENIGGLVFTQRQIPASSADLQDVRSVFAADLDGDLDLDIIAAGEDGDDGQIVWYENDGSEVFTAHVLSDMALGANSVLVADMNGDGRLDVLSASRMDSKIRWFRNDGNQAFTEMTIHSNGTNPPDGAFSVFAADMDADRDLDVLASINYENRVSWFPNVNGLDFGDAPASYPVTLAEDGARHKIGKLYLGAEYDEEADGMHSAAADADDTTGVPDDEDGVRFSSVIAGSTSSSVTVKSSGIGKIDAWLDVNQDGDWLDDGEKILDSVDVVKGDNLLPFVSPEILDSGVMFARVRLSTVGGLNVTGAAPDGEVEDHPVYVQLLSPTITGPATPVDILRPALSWTAVPGAIEYRINVTNLSTNTIGYHLATVSGTSYTPSVDFGIGQYSYTVQAIGTPDISSSYPSPPYAFRIQTAVSGFHVTSVPTTLRPALQWDVLPGAVKYDLWIDNLTTNQMQVIRNATITNTSYTATSNLPFGNYRAWIRGLDASGLPAAWSAALDFSTLPPAPVITQGQNPAYSATPTFAWNAVAGAASYDLVIRNLANGQTYIEERKITAISWTPSSPLPDGVYRWWLVAISPDNVRGIWTDPHDFTLRTVVTGVHLTSNTTLRPVLQWNALPGFTRYDIWFDNLTRQESQFLRDDNVTATTFSPSSDLPYGQYQVWVRAIDASGLPTVWSDVLNLTTLPPAPVITQGLDPVYNQLPTFAWNAVPGASSYDVVIRDRATAGTLIAERNITATSWTLTTPFAESTYRWWLVAISPDNVRGTLSGPHQFVLKNVVLGLHVATPATTLRPVIQWDALPGATRYDVWIDNLTTHQSQFLRDENVVTNSFSPSSDLPFGRYRVWVKGRGDAGFLENWSAAVDFAVILPAPVVTQGLNPTFDRTPTLAWEPLAGAAVYDVLIRKRGLPVNFIEGRSIPTNSWAPTTPIPDGHYEWWVCAISANSIRGEWANGGAWNVGIDLIIGGRTQLLTPMGTITDTTPTFSWLPVEGAARYVLWVDRVGGETQVIYEQNLTTTMFTSAELLAGTYRTWIRAVSTTDELGPFGNYTDFVIADAADSQDSRLADLNGLEFLSRFLVRPILVHENPGTVQMSRSDRRATPVRLEPEETEPRDDRVVSFSPESKPTQSPVVPLQLSDELRDTFIEHWLAYPVSEYCPAVGKS